MIPPPLPPVRRFVEPLPDDTWQSIAARALPDTPEEQAVQRLQSLNLHVFMRPAAPDGSPRAGNPILPSDIIFIDPPGA